MLSAKKVFLDPLLIVLSAYNEATNDPEYRVSGIH